MKRSLFRIKKPTRLQSYQTTRNHSWNLSVVGRQGGKDIPFEGVRMTRSGIMDMRPNLPWGFSIYRCTYNDDKAWNKILNLVQKSVERTLKAEFADREPNERADLMQSHQLVIHDDAKKFNGATSHEVRDDFNIWVAEQLPQVVRTPETLQRELELCAKREQLGGPTPGPEYGFGARFNCALFVDEICLESLDHMSSPVVKILYKQWGNLTPEERNYKIHPEWHDGETDEEEEDVGWMYMAADEYAATYNDFEWTHMAIWHDLYLRPPQMIEYFGEQQHLPGYWRASK
jgi:hypothetical protein